MTVRPRLINVCTAKPPIIVTSIDVIEIQGDFMWNNGIFLNEIEAHPHLHLIGVQQTDRLHNPIVDYAVIMKQIMLRSKHSDVQVIIAVHSTHECLNEFLGARVAKEIRQSAIEVDMQYNKKGLHCISVLLAEDKSCFVSFTAKPSVTEFRKAVDKFLCPEFSSVICREQLGFDRSLWQEFKLRVESTVGASYAKFKNDCLVVVAPLAIHEEIRKSIMAPAPPIEMSKPDRVLLTNMWLSNSNASLRWAYFACVIREFCFVALHFRLTMDLVRKVVKRYTTAHLFSDDDIDKAIISAFYTFEMIRRQRAKTIN